MRRPVILWKPTRDDRLRTLLTRMKLAAARATISAA